MQIFGLCNVQLLRECWAHISWCNLVSSAIAEEVGPTLPIFGYTSAIVHEDVGPTLFLQADITSASLGILDQHFLHGRFCFNSSGDVGPTFPTWVFLFSFVWKCWTNISYMGVSVSIRLEMFVQHSHLSTQFRCHL